MEQAREARVRAREEEWEAAKGAEALVPAPEETVYVRNVDTRCPIKWDVRVIRSNAPSVEQP